MPPVEWKCGTMTMISFDLFKDSFNQSVSSMPRWKVALLFGSPLVFLAGCYYYFLSRKKRGPADFVPSKSLAAAMSSKEVGNLLLKTGHSDEAIDLYSKAISACPSEAAKEMAKIFQNRALAHQINGDSDLVIRDCDSAIALYPKYAKALVRRSKAREDSGDLLGAIDDLMAANFLEEFGRAENTADSEALLKMYGTRQAAALYSAPRPGSLPSPHAVRTYFAAFVRDPIYGPSFRAKGDADSPFLRARRNVLACIDFESVVPLCDDSISDPNGDPHRREAMLLKATFLLLCGRCRRALEALDRLLSERDHPNDPLPTELLVNALVKRGSLVLQLNDSVAAETDFAAAERADPDNPDVYHHRGQMFLLLERTADANKDFERCLDLEPEFDFANFHAAFASYRHEMAQLSADVGEEEQRQCALDAAERFRPLVSRFQECAEGWALFAQILLDANCYAEAETMFRRALEIEPDNGIVQVHLSLCCLQSKQETSAFENHSDVCVEMVEAALKIDPRCGLAHETLGVLETQRGRLDAAAAHFARALELAKTERETAHLITLDEAAKAQKRVVEMLGILMK